MMNQRISSAVTGHRAWKSLSAAALLALVAGLYPAVAQDAAKPAEAAPSLDETRQAMAKWVETRRVLSQERRDWALGQEMLSERIALIQREIDAVRGRLNEAGASITDADKKRGELLAENEKLKQASTGLVAVVAALEERTRGLIKRLPDPIRDRIKPLSQRLPETSETKLSLAERFQNTVGILNEINKFNREITVTSEVRVLPDGKSAEVTVLYIGIGQAYYVGAGGSVAGVGTAGADAWTWKPANELAPQISSAIAILKNEQVASFVKLPIEVK